MMWFLQEKKEIQEFILHKPMMKSKSASEKESIFLFEFKVIFKAQYKQVILF